MVPKREVNKSCVTRVEFEDKDKKSYQDHKLLAVKVNESFQTHVPLSSKLVAHARIARKSYQTHSQETNHIRIILPYLSSMICV